MDPQFALGALAGMFGAFALLWLRMPRREEPLEAVALAGGLVFCLGSGARRTASLEKEVRDRLREWVREKNQPLLLPPGVVVMRAEDLPREATP
jgi:hypothetical protein